MPVRVTGANVLISIHALRVEGDDRAERITINDLFEISIHALRVEGDA